MIELGVRGIVFFNTSPFYDLRFTIYGGSISRLRSSLSFIIHHSSCDEAPVGRHSPFIPPTPAAAGSGVQAFYFLLLSFQTHKVGAVDGISFNGLNMLYAVMVYTASISFILNRILLFFNSPSVIFI